ncbi:MAG: T9SS type B sorting domain-containing protein [Bacteroidia bacterium]|nr:T9SS type B sorting domain-containing protein [Bacteroidia bacterium]
MIRALLVTYLFLALPLCGALAQCSSISSVEFNTVHANPCEFPKTFSFNSFVAVDSTSVLLSSQPSFPDFGFLFDLSFPTNNYGCTYRLDIIGSYTAWGNHERYDAYCKFNNNNGAMISVGGGMGDDLSPTPVAGPSAYNPLHEYSYFFIGDGNDVEYKFRDNNYFDNMGNATFDWHVIPCYEYNWNFGDGNTSASANPSHTYDDAGTYRVTLTITDVLNNCSVSQDTSLTVLEKSEIDLGGSAVICPPMAMELSPGNFQNYLWQDGSTDSVFSANQIGLYWVEVIDAKGCTASDSITIEESCFGSVLIPNAFTPNDDGLNDEFKAYAFRTKLTHYHMYIFDRTGNLIFETEDINQGWNGTFEGSKVDKGIYVYKISYGGIVDNDKFSRNDAGTFIVIR